MYVFTRAAGVWTESAFIKAVTPYKDVAFGHTLALSGDGQYLAVGAVSEARGKINDPDDLFNPLELCSADKERGLYVCSPSG